MTRAPTSSGLFVDLLAPEPSRILAADIAEGLAKLNRWTGSTPGAAFSVAQHSLVVAELMAREDGALAGLYGLLHDAHEYLIGDLPEPTRAALSACSGGEFDALLAALRGRLDRAIHAAFGVDFPRAPGMDALLAECHARVKATEVRDLLSDAFAASDFAEDGEALAEPLKVKLVPFNSWVTAESRFKAGLRIYHAQAGIRRTPAFMEE